MAKKRKPEPENCVVCGKRGGEFGRAQPAGQPVCRKCHGILYREDKSLAQYLAAVKLLGGEPPTVAGKHWAQCSAQETADMKARLQNLINECVHCRALPNRFQQFKTRCRPVVDFEDCAVYAWCYWK
jgi:hypothetical protein